MTIDQWFNGLSDFWYFVIRRFLVIEPFPPIAALRLEFVHTMGRVEMKRKYNEASRRLATGTTSSPDPPQDHSIARNVMDIIDAYDSRL